MRYKSVRGLHLEEIYCVGVGANVCIICCRVIPTDSKVGNHVSLMCEYSWGASGTVHNRVVS